MALPPAAGAPAPEPAMHEAYMAGLRDARLGAQQAVRTIADEAFDAAIRAAMPSEAMARAQPMLIQSEWDAAVCRPDELSRHGGIAYTRKVDIPAAVAAVGYTLRPVAIVASQSAYDLGMVGYHSRKVWCSLQIRGQEGYENLTVHKHLIQLGFGPHVQQNLQADIEVLAAHAMEKVVFRFHPAGGWTSSSVTPLVVSDYLKQFMAEDHFDDIICRQDGSATALVFRDSTAALLRASGRGYVFAKPHAEVERWRDLDMLWLPLDVTLAEALQLAAAEPATFGLACKPGSEGTRFALRFQNAEAMAARAAALQIDNIAALGRYRISGVNPTFGSGGVIATMAGAGWALEEVIFLAENHAIVLASSAPVTTRIRVVQGHCAPTLVTVHAINAAAKAAMRDAGHAVVDVDGEGNPAEAADIHGRARPLAERLQGKARAAKREAQLAMAKAGAEVAAQAGAKAGAKAMAKAQAAAGSVRAPAERDPSGDTPPGVRPRREDQA